MQIKGWRKLVMTGGIGALIVAKPDMTDTQVQLMQTLILAAFAGNGIEHLKEAMQNVRVPGRSDRGAIRSVVDITKSAAPGESGANSH